MDTVIKWSLSLKLIANMLTLVGDGAIKLNQAIPGFMDADVIRDLTGVKGADKPIPAITEVTTDG
ncbi:structural phage protein [Streptococcus pyogenes]|nr:structural phage protein [Streptococcus pyogenes]